MTDEVLRTLRIPRFESAMWGLMAGGAVLATLRGKDPQSYETLAAITAYLIFSWASAAVVLLRAPRPLRPSVAAFGVLVALVAFSNVIEVAKWHDWVETGEPAVHRYQIAFLLVAIGLVLFDCHILAMRTVACMSVEVERRVAEKTREIEENRARVLEALRRQTLARERQRILADMHDGLGATLIGLLRQVQSGNTDRDHVEQRVREALREMRMAIDALQPHEANFSTALGNLRYRLHDLISAGGIHVAWDVEEMPEGIALEPMTMFSAQRIVLEAITNALKHSGARNLHVSARVRADREIELVVEDDGCGFDPSQASAGVGIASMRARAQRIGATLDLRSRTGSGTSLRLAIPETRAAPPLAEQRTFAWIQ